MTADEIRLDRYSKFRKLGMWEEFLVAGGKNKEAREALSKGEPGRGVRWGAERGGVPRGSHCLAVGSSVGQSCAAAAAVQACPACTAVPRALISN